MSEKVYTSLGDIHIKNIKSGLWFYNWRAQRTTVVTLEECLFLPPGLMLEYLVRSRVSWWSLGTSGVSWWNNWINLVFWFGTSFSPSAKFFPSSYTYRSTDFDYDTGKSSTIQEHPMFFWSFWIEGDTPSLTHILWILDILKYIEAVLYWVSTWTLNSIDFTFWLF